MEIRNKKRVMDGIRRNSGSARKILSYAEIHRMRNGVMKNISHRQIIQAGKKKASNFQFFTALAGSRRQKNKFGCGGTIFNFQSTFNVLIYQCFKITKLKIKNSARALFNRNILKKSVALVTIFAVITIAYFQTANNAQSAAYTWFQTSWAGGATANDANHNSNQVGWTQYSSKDGFLSAGTELALSLSNSTSMQTTNAQFGTGTTSQTLVANDSVALDVAGANWSATTIDNTNNTGLYSSIAINSGGLARISYYDNTTNDLMYVECTNIDCSAKNIVAIDSDWAGTWSSIAIGNDGYARISYTANLSSADLDLKYAKCTDSACLSPVITTIDSVGDVGEYTSIAVGLDGFARVSYFADQTDDLKFIQCTNDDCTTRNTTTVDGASNMVGQFTSIVMGTDGFARISYYDITNNNLKFVRCTNANCSTNNISTVDSSVNWVGFYTSIGIDSSGFARISYYDATNTNLKFAQCINADCSTGTSNISTIASGEYSGMYTSTEIAADGFSRISYCDGTTYDIKFVQCTNASCSANNIGVVEHTNGSCASTSIDLDSSDRAHVSYYDPVNTSLKHAYQAPAYYSSGTFTSGVIDTNRNVSSWGSLSWLATLNGQTIQMKARSCDDAACSGEDTTKPFGGDTDAEWDNVGDTCNTITSDAAMSTGNCVTNGERYLQYKARLKTSDTSVTPTLDSMNYGYYYYDDEQFFYSSEYDTTDSTNVLSSIAWSETLGISNTDAQFQVRTSADGITWSNWCGPDNGTTGCSTSTYFTDPAGGETVDADFTNSTDDQWIQYKIRLTSATGQYTPTVADVTMTYVVNAAPTVTVNSAIQNSDGTIAINYDLSDTDDSSFTVSAYADLGITLNETLDSSDTTITLSATTLLPTAGTIMLDSEQVTYTGKSGNDLTGCTRGANTTRAAAHSSGAVAWAKATTAAGNIGASQSAGAGKNITWTINTDYDGVYRNSSQGKIRVSANDLNLANQVGNGDSSTFAIDTKNPTGFAISSIDHTQNQVVITAATEDSNYEVYIGNASGTLFDAGNITSPLLNQGSSYPNTYTYASMTSDPATVYVGVKDAKGNTAYTQMTTPAKPTNPIYYDTSSEPQGIYQEFVAWDVVSAAQVGSGWSAYKIYRKINSGSYSLLATITDRSTNYYLDKIFGTDTESDPSFDVNNPSTYTYKITTTDTAGNISAYSTTVSDIPNGTGGSDSTAPTISNVTVSNINTTSATVTWDTDELSSSYVGYSTDTSYLPERGLASMVTSHEITLTGLDSDTTYNIRVKSYDAIGNLGQNDKDSPGNNVILDFTFDTLAGPEISSVTVDSNNTTATVSWATTTDSDTYVIFSDEVLNGALVNPLSVGTPNRVGGTAKFNHAQTLDTYESNPLISGATYYFYVTSKDNSNVTAVDDNGGEFYSFSTTQDDDAPDLGTPSVVVRNSTQAVISWTTNEGANSTVNYGTTSGNLTLSGSVVTYDTSHYVILSGLTANTTYYYKITSADINTNSTTSTEYSFTTLRNPEEQHDPLATITMLYNTGGAAGDPKVLTDTKAVIAFNTDQPALCTIEYGTNAGSYTEVPVAETSYNENHSMHLAGLIFSTKHYYRITCEDNLDTAISSSEYNFTTSDQLNTEAGWADSGDTTVPEISGISAKAITGESATIKWDTDEDASSLIKYGMTTDFGSMAGNDAVNTDQENYISNHEVIINGLIPNTKYYYTAVSVDVAGNIAESGEKNFTTSSPSQISSLKFESKSLGQIKVTWKTSKETTSIVEYGLTDSYSERKESSVSTREHEIEITSLNSSVTYHFRVKGKDKDGNLYSSADYTFEPKSPPKISDVRVEEITEHSAKVRFSTNVPTDALVTYMDSKNKDNSGFQGRPEISSTHDVELKNLSQGTTFEIKIKVRDEEGNETEEVFDNLTTLKDENPPKIEKVRTDSALAQGDKIQTIVRWSTDELAVSSFLYKEGRNGEEKEIKVSEAPVKEHISVITAFKSGTVYYFKAKAIDQSNNATQSNEFAILTPKKKENIVQIIVNNFQDIFKWARF